MNLTKPNYHAWLVQAKNYPQTGSLSEKLMFLLRYAILAPSAHNTQAWKFKIANNQIQVFIDKTRALKEGDLEQRQTYESIGTCLTNICVAAKHFGFRPAIEYVVEGGLEDENKILAATVTLNQNNSLNSADNLFDYITQRHSAKLEYKNEPVNGDTLKKLQNLNNFSELQLNLYNSTVALQSAAKAVILGTEKAFSDKGFCVELSHWLRNNYTKQFDGMPGFTVGMPGPISLLASFMIGHLNTVKMQSSLAKKTMANTYAFGVISGPNNKLSYIKAGELYQTIALTALQSGLNTAPMGAPIEIIEAAELLKSNLNLPQRPLLFFRVGRQNKDISVAPRKNIEDFI